MISTMADEFPIDKTSQPAESSSGTVLSNLKTLLETGHTLWKETWDAVIAECQ